MNDWTPEKEKRALWKYRFVLTYRIIRILLILILTYSIYQMVIGIIYEKSDKGEELSYYASLRIDWTLPGLKSDPVSIRHNTEITPFLTEKATIPVYRTIGKESHLVGEMNFSRNLFGLSSTEYKFNQSFGDSKFSFYLPQHPETNQKLTVNQSLNTWDILEKIHEGTVADLAFSTKEYYSPEELYTILEPYDLDIIWMPVYMGEIKNFKEGSWSWSGNNSNFSIDNPWGLSYTRYTDGSRVSGIETFYSLETIKLGKEGMLNNMRAVRDKDKDLAWDIFGTKYLDERINYLEENGFQVYGAVVTGPVKELLKLRELEQIHGAQIGDFDYWNWE